ncbi:ATP-dependent zinc protease [Phycicoccus sp. HDW14]|uniref:ATP-dependent zinc protease family protein n=1 Tax=Phycicoccus sp. HDW14 TaxID=2714941 RepID=UPI00140AFB59|nr:ATP-dependent zinc protease [Phycicoccus sp. HDW14]QIM20582.1 ATP-dependent zinc protease [Phycicoccus sp. HDW14]
MTDSHSYTLAGWREWVSLPGVGVPWVKAKLDTGARSSAIHAFDLEETTREGERWVRFSVHPWQKSDEDAVDVECPVLDTREVRSSSGHSEERLVVALDLTLVGRTLPVEVTLARRDEMGFRMLVGREALRQGYAVDPGASYLGGRPPLRLRRRNRGAG